MKSNYNDRKSNSLKRTVLLIAACLTASSAHAVWDADLRTNEMTDERIGFAAEKGSPSGSFVGMQCQQGAEIIVTFILPVNEKLRGRITYRIDDEEASTVPGFTINGGVGVLGLDAKNLIPKLLNGSKIIAHGHQTGFSAEPTRIFKFDLAGSSKAFSDACSWHPDYKSLTS